MSLSTKSYSIFYRELGQCCAKIDKLWKTKMFFCISLYETNTKSLSTLEKWRNSPDDNKIRQIVSELGGMYLEETKARHKCKSTRAALL